MNSEKNIQKIIKLIKDNNIEDYHKIKNDYAIVEDTLIAGEIILNKLVNVEKIDNYDDYEDYVQDMLEEYDMYVSKNKCPNKEEWAKKWILTPYEFKAIKEEINKRWEE